MSWSPLILADPVSDASALGQNIVMFTVSPWTSGVKEGSGNNTWLSFPNAVEAVANKVDTTQAVFAIAITAASLTDLAIQAGDLAQVFPIKQLNQWQGHAEKLAVLEVDKFDLIDLVPDSNSMALNAVSTVRTQMEKAISQATLSEANALSSADPLSNLSSFQSDKTAHDASVNVALPALSGGAGYRFYAESDIKNALTLNQLDHRFTLTAMIVFSGSPADLAYLVEMMP